MSIVDIGHGRSMATLNVIGEDLQLGFCEELSLVGEQQRVAGHAGIGLLGPGATLIPPWKTPLALSKTTFRIVSVDIVPTASCSRVIVTSVWLLPLRRLMPHKSSCAPSPDFRP